MPKCDVYKYGHLMLLLIFVSLFTTQNCVVAKEQPPQSSQAVVAETSQPKKRIVKRVAMILFRGETPAEKGFRDTLALSKDFDMKISVFDANQDKEKLKSIVADLDPSQFDIFYVFGTMAAQTLAKKIQDKPIVFNIVQRPIEALLVKGWEHSGNNITGASNIVSMESAFRTLSLVMSIRKLAFIYYETDPAPKFQRAEIEDVRKKFGFNVVDIPVSDVGAIPKAMAKIIQAKVDAVMFPSDSFIKANANGIMKVLNQHRIPSVVIIPEMVKDNGALISLGPNYYKLGELAGDSTLEILRGTKPTDIPIKRVQNLNISVNLNTADRLGVNLPIQLLSLATVIH